MQVSVIIPAYKATGYVRQAVESALAQPETAEVILIEDGPSDGSFEVCRELVDRDTRVRLMRHPDGRNHCASASRNLGALAATCDRILLVPLPLTGRSRRVFERRLCAHYHTMRCFEGYRDHAPAVTRRHLLAALFRDPELLGNRGLLRMGLRACAGRGK